MSKCNQFLLLLWKNWTLQKRGVLKTIFEIGLPLFFILILVLLRVTKIKVEQKKADSYNAFDIAVLPNGLEKYQHLAFTPNNTDIAEVVSAASSKLKLRAPKGFPSESEMVNFLSSSFAKNKNNSGFLGGIVFDTKNLTNPHITYKIRLSSRERNSKKQKANLFKDGSTSWHTKFMYPQFQKPGPREDKSIHGGPPGYYDEGFLTVQLAVDTALMEYKTKNASTNVVISIRRFPYPAYIKDPFILVIQQSFPVLLMLSLLFTALNIVRSVVHEKERKLKESMKMMGLSGWLHWTAWFCKYLLYLLITMVIATILCTVKFNSNGRVLNKSDPSLIFVILLLYSISSIMFCFCVSVFFSKANLAGAAGGIIWYLSYVPYYFISQSYENMNLAEKLVSCLLSNVAMGMGAQLVGKFEGIGTGVQWSNITKGVSVDDSLSLGLVLLMFLVDSILYGIITWYVETVFPGDYGVPRPWYFPVLPSYWCGTSTKVEVEDESPLMNGSSKSYGAVWDVVDADSFFEKDPIGLNAGVRMNNLKKVFSTEKGKKIAVNGVSLNLYDGQITALLGHNGAGKTTLLSMLTGLFPPTSGSAAVNGYDIVKDITSVRQSLGICPQHNVLFDSLTVEEHLWFFAKLKGCPSHKVSVQVEQMIHAVGLNDKRHTQARALSGGMKRKLSVGIAFIADSKIVMLDEPTSGMDPSARRFTWDLIQQQRAGRTILLTTHFMDEADLLGDRIAIMAEGTVKCCGTPLFLKKKYGVGYHMIMVKEPGCDIGRITNVVTKHIPTAQLESNVGAELSYILPHEATGKFEELFTELETQKDDLRIASYGASVTTMEEVFLKVGEGMDSTLRSKVTRENFPENQRTKDDVYSSENARLGTFGSEVSIGPSTNYKHNTGMALNLQRWKAMFVKKFLHSKRHKVSILFQLLLPLLFTLIALVNAKSFPKPTDSPPLVLVPDRFGSNVIPVRISGKTSMAKAHEFYQEYVNQFEGKVSQTVHVTDTEDMQSYLLRKARSDGVGYFNRRDLLAANFYQHGDIVNITAWFNNQPYHAIAISLAAVQNAVFRVMVGSDQSLTTINHPLPRSAQDKINDLSRNATGFLISFTLLFSMAFLSSSFILFLVQERSNKAKHVQLVSGVDPISYWTSAYLWDMINFMIPSCTLLILFVAFDVPAYRGVRLGYVFLVMVMYGWGVIPLMYLFSFVFKTPSTAFVILAMFNILTGLATLMTVNILSIPQLKLLDVANALKWAFLVLPNYCLGQGLSDIFNNYNSINFYNKLLNMCMKYLHHNAKECDKFVREIAGPSRLQFQTNYLAWENPGVGRYLVFLAIEGVVIFYIVLMIEYGVFRFSWSAVFRGINKNYHAFDKSLPEDDDVKAERTRILSGQLLPDVLVIKELTKVFNSSCYRCLSAPSASLVAVDHLSLGISQGECFGLLGINGAGKTTTFRMLTGDESTTSGTAILDSNDIHQNMNKVRQRLGYCPQFDALIGEMTGRELLFMYARLRGVPEALIPEVSENLIQMLLLQDHADKVSKSYSGGNKRKLSTAISLVGDPPVVFLDEPTTGMDPVARRLLWDALSKVRAEGRSIVITSHSMDECEALCTRLAIMVNGRFKCLGSTQHLKTKFGQGYTLLAKVGPMSHTNMLADTRPLKEFIEGSFPGSILKDEHEGMVHYHICDPRISWAQIFGVIERNKLNYCIEDYSVSQTTLEQVFLNFARSQREAEE